MISSVCFDSMVNLLEIRSYDARNPIDILFQLPEEETQPLDGTSKQKLFKEQCEQLRKDRDLFAESLEYRDCRYEK